MPRQTLILSVLIVLRLLLPPGICVCKLSSPAARFLAAAWGAKLPPPPPAPTHDEDVHAPGCPASSLAEGLGVAPPSGPGTVAILLFTAVGWAPGLDVVDPLAAPDAIGRILPPCALSVAAAPHYVAHCALLF